MIVVYFHSFCCCFCFILSMGSITLFMKCERKLCNFCLWFKKRCKLDFEWNADKVKKIWAFIFIRMRVKRRRNEVMQKMIDWSIFMILNHQLSLLLIKFILIICYLQLCNIKKIIPMYEKKSVTVFERVKKFICTLINYCQLWKYYKNKLQSVDVIFNLYRSQTGKNLKLKLIDTGTNKLVNELK